MKILGNLELSPHCQGWDSYLFGGVAAIETSGLLVMVNRRGGLQLTCRNGLTGWREGGRGGGHGMNSWSAGLLMWWVEVVIMGILNSFQPERGNVQYVTITYDGSCYFVATLYQNCLSVLRLTMNEYLTLFKCFSTSIEMNPFFFFGPLFD